MDHEKQRARECFDRYRSFANKLLADSEIYFSDGYLNSEGMKILGLISRVIGEHCPEYIRYAKRARRTRKFEDVLKLLALGDHADPG